MKNFLDSKASDAIQGTNLASENYEHAVCVLKERFSDSQVIITASMDSLVDLKPIFSSQDMALLRKFMTPLKFIIKFNLI